MGNRILLS